MCAGKKIIDKRPLKVIELKKKQSKLKRCVWLQQAGKATSVCKLVSILFD